MDSLVQVASFILRCCRGVSGRRFCIQSNPRNVPGGTFLGFAVRGA